MTFRFDRNQHRYFLDGEEVPHTTELLKRGGMGDNPFYTENGRDRGKLIHDLTAAYDLGALDLASVEGECLPYLRAYAKTIKMLRPTFEAVEVALVDPVWRWGGRPDRELLIADVYGVLEIKTGGVEPWHAIQTALHALLVATKTGLPASSLARRALYLDSRGRGKLEQHRDCRDLIRAQHLVQKYGGRNGLGQHPRCAWTATGPASDADHAT